MARFIWLWIIVIAIGGCSTTAAMTYHNKYLTMWEQQLDDYRAKFIEQDKRIRQKEGGFILARTTETDNEFWNKLVSRVMEISVDVRDAFVTAGRGEAIKAFITHMNAQPTPGMTDTWFQRQAMDITEYARAVDERSTAFFSQFDDKLRQGPEWIMEVEQLARDQGMARGKLQELSALYKQAESYYREQQHANALDQARALQQQQAAQQLLASLAYVNQLNYQQQLLNTLNRPRTCTVMGNFLTCQ